MQCQEALDKCRTNKSIMSETNRGQLGVLQEMSSWCLQDLGTKMNRTKIETLVTIQVVRVLAVALFVVVAAVLAVVVLVVVAIVVIVRSGLVCVLWLALVLVTTLSFWV